jgi:hypothetical protein
LERSLEGGIVVSMGNEYPVGLPWKKNKKGGGDEVFSLRNSSLEGFAGYLLYGIRSTTLANSFRLTFVSASAKPAGLPRGQIENREIENTKQRLINSF